MADGGVFDMNTPEEFFASIQRTFEEFRAPAAKPIEGLLYVVMGLNHLREWIAPGYDPKHDAQSSAEEFHDKIYREPSFKTVKQVCNMTKHLAPSPDTSSTHGLKMDDWDAVKVDSVRDFDLGPASDYFVDGRNVIDICEDVIRFYREEWFERDGATKGETV